MIKSEMFNFTKLFLAAVRPVVIVFFSAWMMINPASAQKMAKTEKVADGVYAYQEPAINRTSMFVVTSDGVVVFDPMNPKFAKGMLKGIRSVTNKPIKYLSYSHNHFDHIGGGQVFKDEGATVLAHREAGEYLKGNPNKKVVVPDELWAGSQKNIVLGGTTIELRYLGMNHGLGMNVVLLPKEKVIYIVDLVTPNRVLFDIVPDFNLKELARSIGEIEAMEFDKVIFSHGSPAIGSKTHITEAGEFLGDLKKAIFAEFKKGTPFGKITSVVRLPKYKDWGFYDKWLEKNASKQLIEIAIGPFPWRATPDYEPKMAIKK